MKPKVRKKLTSVVGASASFNVEPSDKLLLAVNEMASKAYVQFSKKNTK